MLLKEHFKLRFLFSRLPLISLIKGTYYFNVTITSLRFLGTEITSPALNEGSKQRDRATQKAWIAAKLSSISCFVLFLRNLGLCMYNFNNAKNLQKNFSAYPCNYRTIDIRTIT